MSLLDVSEVTRDQLVTVEVRRIPSSPWGHWEADAILSMHPHNPLYVRAIGAGQNEAFDTLKTNLRILGFTGEIQLH